MARTVVGLDIGSSGVRAAEFRVGRRAPSLRRFASVPLPEGAVRSGAVVDAPAVTEALRDLWSKGKFTSKAVVLGIANENVLVRQMDLDWMPPADFRKALSYQVQEGLPVSVEEANLDYHLLEEVEVASEDGEETRRVARILLVAAAREVVDGFVEAVQAAGLRPVHADLMPFALIRGTRPAATEHGLAEAIVDIGADTVAVVVHHGGQPQFVRMIPGLGGQRITRALQERYDWSWEDAEHTKIVVGLPGHAAPEAAGQDLSALGHPAQQVIIEQVDALATEVRTTLQFFLDSTTSTTALSRVVLTGAGAQLGGLAQVLSERIGVPVETFSALDGLRKRRRLRLDEQQQIRLTVPAGLCIGVSTK